MKNIEPDYEARLRGFARYLKRQEGDVYIPGIGGLIKGASLDDYKAIIESMNVRMSFNINCLSELRLWMKEEFEVIRVNAHIKQVRQLLRSKEALVVNYKNDHIEVCGFKIYGEDVYCELREVAVAVLPDYKLTLVTWSPDL